MEDSELEEGEACSYNNNNFHNDAGIDPDVAYSYIDEKLHHVLGHFQKEFEVGFTVEDLGAKFGGYGSFLDEQPPGGSHSIIPHTVQSHEASKSPTNRQSEGAARAFAISSVISRSSRPVPHANNAETAPASKPQVKNDSSKPETCMKRAHTNTFEHRHESKDKNCNLTDQKSLKFRLKVPDNLSTRQNAVMNSLGLDASPSSSLDDSPSEFEGLFQDTRDGVNVSPTSILQVMTSFIVPENLILSPLPDGMLDLSEREVLGTENLWCSRTVGVLHEDKRLKTVERTDFPGGKNLCGDYWDDNEHADKKAPDVDNLAAEVHVSNLSNAQPSNSSSVGKVKSKRGSVEKSLCDMPRGQPTELKETREMNMKSSKAISGGKVREDRTTLPDDVLNYPNKDLHGKGKKFCEPHDFDSIKGQTILNTQVTGKSVSSEQDGVKIVSRKEHSSERKRKLKGSNSSLAAKGLEESVKVGCSIMLKTKNISKVCSSMKSDLEDVKAPKPCLKAEDTYKDFFGDLGESDQEDNQASLSRVQDKQREFQKVEKGAIVNNTNKDKMPGKKTDDPWASESYSGTTRHGAPHFTHVNMPDALHTTTAPANDNWVCCDKCGKWRLLPPGKNPENFPEKWVCSMLDWLPGMNRCSIVEEETTKAIVLKFERPFTENQGNLHGNPINMKSSGPPAEVDHDLQHVAPYLMPNGGRKKNGLREVPGVTNIECLDQLPETLKRRTHESIRSASVSDANQSPLVGDHRFQNRSASCDLLDKEQKNKQKTSDKVTEHNLVGGDSKSSKMKGKRITDQDLHRGSKKRRVESSFVACEDQMSDHSGVLRKGAILHSSGSPAQSVGKSRPKHRKPSSSKDLKFDKSDVPSISMKGLKEKHQVPAAGLISRGNTDEEHVTKKRKATEFRSKQNDIGPCPNTSNDLPESRICAKEEFSENEYLKEKRSKVFNSEINETLVSKENSRLDVSGVKPKRNLQQGQDSRSTLPQQSFDVIDTFKKDSASIQPSATAASSSSKVSVSHRAKPSSNDGKGSPVESVSSSPMRLTNCDKVRKNIVQKDECHDVGCLTLGSPRRCSDGDSNGGSDRSEAERKQKASTEAQHGSHESSVLDFQEKDMSCFPVGHAKTLNAVSGDIRKCQFANGTSDYSGQETQYHFKPTVLDQSHCREDDENHNSAGGIRSRKSGKGSSRSKDRNRSSKSSLHETLEHASPYEIKPREGRNKFCEKYVAKSDEIENKYTGKKESFRKSSESNRREKEGLDSKTDVTGNQDLSSGKRTSVLVTPDDRNTKECNLEKSSQLENVFAEATPLLPSGGAQTAMLSSCPQAVIRAQKENGVEPGGVDSVQGDDKLHKQIKKSAQQNGIQTHNSRHPVTSGQKTKDIGAPSSQRKDLATQAATAIKEAKALKHLGDPLWKSGNADDAALYYFQSTLKFLHGASLLESSSNETAKHEDMIQAMQIYSTTAKLCEFSAHEYERSKDTAAAALAYKCIEVALMRVIYCTHTTVTRARHELQSSLQMIPLGESPSSSASDVDNLNQPINLEKATLPRGVNSPQVTVNNGVAARTRSNLTRLISLTQNVNSAMDASRKSRAAFAASEAGLERDQLVEGLTAVRRALDFNFQDMEGLLRLVRLAMEAIGH